MHRRGSSILPTMSQMKLIIDPALFAHFSVGCISSVDDYALLRYRLRQLVLVLRATGASIVLEREAWKNFYADHVSPAHAQCKDPEIRAAIAIVRRAYVPVAAPTVPVRTWGILSLLNTATGAAAAWADAVATSAASVLLSGDKVLVFTDLDEGRNRITHRVGHSILVEKTRWALYVGAIGLGGATRVPCVTSVRNTQVDWTARFDDGLPETAPGHGFRFAPPNDWWKRATMSTKTVRGKPAWLDHSGNGWVAPNTPGVSYHWDVHFGRVQDSPNGLNPCNIVKWGVPANEGTAGAVHHVPTSKASRAR